MAAVWSGRVERSAEKRGHNVNRFKQVLEEGMWRVNQQKQRKAAGSGRFKSGWDGKSRCAQNMLFRARVFRGFFLGDLAKKLYLAGKQRGSNRSLSGTMPPRLWRWWKTIRNRKVGATTVVAVRRLMKGRLLWCACCGHSEGVVRLQSTSTCEGCLWSCST